LTRVKYKDDCVNLFNLGVGGNTGGDILKRFEAESAVRLPTDIIFSFGINDSAYFDNPTKPVVENTNFKTNLQNLIKQSKTISQNVTFIGPVLGDDSILQQLPGRFTEKSYTKERAIEFDDIIKETSATNKCSYIHLMDKLNFEDFLDGLHPNDRGHKKMFEEIKKYF
jgi:lysophospholipase L1-like esterase